MYFKSRVEAGVKLAELLMKYRYENTAVVALSRGGVRIGYQIAANLHCPLFELLSETIEIDGESLDFATVMPGGVVARNPELSQSEQDFYYSEHFGAIEDDMRTANQRINQRLLGDGGDLDPDQLRDRVVILVSDGMKTGTMLEAAIIFLKPIRVTRVVVATPVASVEAVDKMHILADELHVLNVTPNFINVDHYYDVADEPTTEQARALINHTILGWQ